MARESHVRPHLRLASSSCSAGSGEEAHPVVTFFFPWLDRSAKRPRPSHAVGCWVQDQFRRWKTNDPVQLEDVKRDDRRNAGVEPAWVDCWSPLESLPLALAMGKNRGGPTMPPLVSFRPVARSTKKYHRCSRGARSQPRFIEVSQKLFAAGRNLDSELWAEIRGGPRPLFDLVERI